nr:hypothetical protein [Tanacetum cinerariifolium]
MKKKWYIVCLHLVSELSKQAEKGVPLQAEQFDWIADTDEKIDEQELEAHYGYMAKIQEVPTADSVSYWIMIGD